MDAVLNQRADRAVERYNTKRNEYRKDHLASKEAAAHELLLAKVPDLAAKIGRSISEFNDRASDTNLRVEVHVDGAPHFALTIFKISAVGVFDPCLELLLTVDQGGDVIGFISGRGDKARLMKLPIADLNETHIFEMILELVERELDSH